MQTEPASFFWLVALSSPLSLRSALGPIVPEEATPQEMVDALVNLTKNQDYQTVFQVLRDTRVNYANLAPEARQAVREALQVTRPIPLFSTTDPETQNQWWTQINWGEVGQGTGGFISSIICLFTDCPQNQPPEPTPDPNPNPNPDNGNGNGDDKKGWSTGWVIAAVAGGVLVFGTIIGLIVWAVNKK